MELNQLQILNKILCMLCKILMLCSILVSISCNNNASSPTPASRNNFTKPVIKPDYFAQIKNIPLPLGYTRIENGEDSFATWLQNVGLKKDKTVYKFDGTPKANQTAQFAVLDISVGARDLQQCADAVMRLRAEYLFANERYTEIVFIDNENIFYKLAPPYTKEHFAAYLNKVFGMCGSASLAKQLKAVSDINKIAGGNVIIRGGFPGHAVIVMDVAQNTTGEKIYLLAQSYMPAQDIHVLLNPANEDLSPWYTVTEENIIHTPEYIFYKNELKAW